VTLSPSRKVLLTTNYKTEKAGSSLFLNPLTGKMSQWDVYILQMTPHTQNSQGKNLCPMADGCEKTCLVYSGRGGFQNVYEGRKRRTELFVNDKSQFMEVLIKEITALKKKADKKGHCVAIRLNGFSDIRWENIKVEHKGTRSTIFDIFPDVMFYDYTKIPIRTGLKIRNYDVTFSGSVSSLGTVVDELRSGGRVAMVFKEIPQTYMGYPVVDGDSHDLRFTDPHNVVVGLKYKVAKGQDNSKPTIVMK